MATASAKRKTVGGHGNEKAKDSVRSLVSSELSYLKKAEVLLLGSNKWVSELARYFYRSNRKARLTILSFGRKELLDSVNATSRFGNIRYAYSKGIYTGLPEDEFGLIVSYGTFDRMGNNKSVYDRSM